MRRLSALMVSFAFVYAAPTSAAAQETFELPENCTAHLTMQSAACSVSHYFTCDGDAEGTQRRIDLDEQGVSYVGQIDSETQWLVSAYRDSGHTERLEDAPSDRSSFTELLDEGISTFDFRTLSEEIGPLRYVGVDQLTGEDVTIDGVTLLGTEFVIRAENEAGEVIFTSEGREYVSPEWRTFFGGTSSVTTPNGTAESDNSPIEFFLPGDDGFLSASPKYGCGATESSWQVPG